MANFIGNVVTPRVSTRSIVKVLVPAGGLHAGQVVSVSDLDVTIPSNYEVFAAQVPTAESITESRLAMIIDSTIEVLQDGRRPDGQPNFTTYSYKEGEVATAVFLDAHLRFRVSVDSLDSATSGAIAVGSFLIPVAGSNNLAVAAGEPVGIGNYLKVLARYDMSMGGQFGLGYIPAYICVAHSASSVGAGNNFLSFTLPNQVSSDIDNVNGIIDIEMAGPTTGLAATFTVSPNATVTVNGVPQVSGETVHDFSFVVDYVVTSSEGDAKTYSVVTAPAQSVLNINAGENVTVSVTRQGTEVNNGSPIAYGDVLTITTTYSEGYENATLTVNGVPFTSGDTFTVGAEDVTVSATAQLTPYTVTIQQGEGTSLIVVKDQEFVSNGGTVYYGDQIAVTATAEPNFTLESFTINGVSELDASIPVYHTVTGNTTIVTTATATA